MQAGASKSPAFALAKYPGGAAAGDGGSAPRPGQGPHHPPNRRETLSSSRICLQPDHEAYAPGAIAG